MNDRPKNALERRRQLLATGYSVIPLYGKVPPNTKNNKRGSLTKWEQLGDITEEMLVMWNKTWPDAQNTGILTRTMPTLDLDILNEEAVRACEDHVREQYEEKGPVLVRVGLPPKMAIPFRTIEPFPKFVVDLIAPNGSNEKIEFLADGAQVVAFGIHPETKQPYRWHGGQPGETKLQDLPYIRGDAAHQLVDELVLQILVERFGYLRTKERPGKHNKGNGQNVDEADRAGAPADWQYLIDNIRNGQALHDSSRDLAAKMIASGMSAGAAVNALRALMDGATCPHDERWRERRDDIPRLVDSAVEKYAPPPEPGANEKVRERNRKANSPLNAEALSTMTFPPIKSVVPDIIVEGLTLLAGKPKIGKSWLVLHAGLAVARGGFTLGDLHCIEGDVLYCALEDNPRRLQSRLTKLCGMPPWNVRRLDFYCELPRLADGGLAVLEEWIQSKPHPRLIVIDVLAMVRPQKRKDQTNYESDYAAVLQLRELASRYRIAIIAVAHLRKADADDAFDLVSGTLGLTGAPDSVLVLRRDSSGSIILHGRGRDLVEIEKAMVFDPESCIWRITGEASAVRRTNERATVLQTIDDASEPLSPTDIAAASGMKVVNVKFLLRKLLEEGAVERVGYGKYRTRKEAA